MILQSLVKRYEDTAAVLPGWQKRNVSYALIINQDGILLNILPLGGEKGCLALTLPSKTRGRSGPNAYKTAYFLCDDGNYMLGFDPKKFESSKKLHSSLLSGVETPSAQAIIAYFNNGAPSLPHTFDPKNIKTAKYVFQFNGKRIDYEDCGMEIRFAWENKESQPDKEKLCLISGEKDAILQKHDKVRLRGVKASEQALISMNKQTSFRSYGTKPNDPPAQIGAKAVFAYTTELNALLGNDKNHQSIGGDTLVYWADGAESDSEELVFSWTMNPTEDNESQLDTIIPTILRGQLPDITNINWQIPFYILCLSPNAARISIRFFHVSSFGDTINKIADHINNLEIYSSRKENLKYIPYCCILSETTIKGSKSDAHPLLGGQLINSIISGARYPALLFNAILLRIRAGGDINRTKAAIIKAFLIRNYYESEVTTVALNQNSNNKPYVLGRLFSVLQQLQNSTSSGSLNATIRDRYFASACANPGSVFPTLLKLSMHHAAKSDYAIRYEKLKGELLGKLDCDLPFPATLSLDDQGRFIIGYYHQTQDFFTPKKDKEEREEA